MALGELLNSELGNVFFGTCVAYGYQAWQKLLSIPITSGSSPHWKTEKATSIPTEERSWDSIRLLMSCRMHWVLWYGSDGDSVPDGEASNSSSFAPGKEKLHTH